MRRAAGYFLARLAENVEFHTELSKEGALDMVVSMASLEDIECQEYSAFALAHLASNRELQVRLVELGALKPLVSMMAVMAEPRHYAGLALLKLADNFENHVAIAKEGGIQALLRLGRERTTDEELQYKAALTVGSLAANAVKMLPRENGRGGNMEIGFGSSSMMQSKATVAAQRGRERTTDFLESQLDSEGAEK